ncbi:hypothetical protein BDF14DRAFT_1877298 [Spinellus fusiger]|nr:hypothetical protein BDF14DRAFT_1877298 [Spinellus fusiger]
MQSFRTPLASIVRHFSRPHSLWRPRPVSTRTFTTRNLLYRTEKETLNGFSTSAYTESMRNIKSQAKFIGKLTGLSFIAVLSVTFIAWQSYHLYIEYFLESTPNELSYKVRSLIRGAYVREKLSPDYELASTYLREALQVALEEDKVEESTPCITMLRLRLANDEAHAGNLLEALAEYSRAWHFLLELEKDPSTASKAYTTLVAHTAKNMGDLYLRVGDYTYAEEFLAWALHVAAKAPLDVKEEEWRHFKVTTTCSLASVYAVQSHFELALPLFLQALREIPENTPRWICMRAILQNQLAETMFGMGKMEEAMGWAQASFESCSAGVLAETDSTQREVKDCHECGAIVANNLGKLLELKGQLNEAAVYYKEAQVYALKLQDTDAFDKYGKNIQRIYKRTDTPL